MGGFGTILGGALTGLGAGIAKQGEMDYETRRQSALETLRQQNAQALEGTRNQNAQSNMRIQAEEQRTTQRERALLDDKLDENSQNRRTGATIKINQVQAENEKALVKFRSNAAINEYQSKAATDLANELAVAGQTVGEMKVAADGSIWAYSKTGKKLGNSNPGKFNPPATSGASGEGSALSRAGGMTGAQPATPGAKVSTSNW